MTQGTTFNYLPEGEGAPKFLRFATKIGYVGVKQDDALNIFRAYWLIAPHLILTLTLGYLFVVISFTLGIKPEASGAVLVGAGVVAEFFHSRWLYRKLTDVDTTIFMFPAVCRTFHLNPRALKDLSVPEDFYPEARSDETPAAYDSNWNYPKTAHRIDNKIFVIVTITIILGTFLWGYADLFSTCKYLCG